MNSDEFKKMLDELNKKVIFFEPSKKPVGKPFNSESGKNTKELNYLKRGLLTRRK